MSNETMDVDVKVAQYVKLRDYLETAKKEFDESMSRVKEAMKKLEGEFQLQMQDTNQTKLCTNSGTVHQIKRSSCSVKERDTFFRWAIENRELEAMDIRANKKVVRELLEKGHEIPGINYSESIQIGVRRGNV